MAVAAARFRARLAGQADPAGEQPYAVSAATILATKGGPLPPPSGVPQRAQRPSETLVDLNFKVPIRRRFNQLALDADLKNVQLLRRAVDAYERTLLAESR